jgi:SAM-dependent methyltransferase
MDRPEGCRREVAIDYHQRSMSRFAPYVRRRFPRVRRVVRKLPLIGTAMSRLSATVRRRSFPGSAAYWEVHYARGGASGPGSQGQLAAFKADVMNEFVRRESIRSIVEFGCGDGSQLLLAQYPEYVGLDVSPTAIRICQGRFAHDSTKLFRKYDPEEFAGGAGTRMDAAISLDVIYHLVEDDVFRAYLDRLFEAARRYVVIFSSNEPLATALPYVKHRAFTKQVEAQFPDWALSRTVRNPHVWQGDASTGSRADFYFYRRKS